MAMVLVGAKLGVWSVSKSKSGFRVLVSYMTLSQEILLYSGQIKSWTVAKSKASKFVGSIAISCTDVSELPALTLGFNGSDQVRCNSSLMDAKTIPDPKDGIYTFR